MSYYTQWELYGKLPNNTPIPSAQIETLLDELEDISDEWYGDGDGGIFLCSYMTDSDDSYDQVMEIVSTFSASMPEATFKLTCYNEDGEWYQHIHILNGDHETLDGEIIYESPKHIYFDQLPDDPWAAYCQYLREWADSHTDRGFEGFSPVCYDEFLSCEWQQMHKDDV